MQVKIWDPSLRGSELRATLKGHTRYLWNMSFHHFTLQFFPVFVLSVLSYGLGLIFILSYMHRIHVKFLWLYILSQAHLEADKLYLVIIYRTVRAVSSDRGKVVSGSDDWSVFVWDKQTSQLLEELKGHDAQVCLEH